jgi:hypothetical protein
MVAIKKNKKSGIGTWDVFVITFGCLYMSASLSLMNMVSNEGVEFSSSLRRTAPSRPKRPFTPANVLNGRLDEYVSMPVLDANVTYDTIQARVQKAMAREVGEPMGLLHQGHPPGHDVVMGLASWPTAFDVFRTMVGSLRHTGFDGHIILGVHPNIPAELQDYLKKMDVTLYTVEMVPCDASISEVGGNNLVRGKCAKGIEYLTLEKGRFQLLRQWLHACNECKGWALATDTRDLLFQRPPFAGLDPPDKSPFDLLFIEEIAPHSQPARENPRTNIRMISDGFFQGSDGGCYGHHYHEKYPDRAILCSGTVIGNRQGMDRFLAVFVDEFLENNAKTNPICKSSQTPDQLILQPLYYSGHFGDFERTRTSPWGAGPVNTIGVPCVDERNDPSHSALDLTEFDLETGLILNPNVKDGHPFRIAPIIHQFDRCDKWIWPYFEKHGNELFGLGGLNKPIDQVKPVPWL